MSTSHSEKRVEHPLLVSDELLTQVEQREEFPRFLDMYRSYCTRQHASLSICVCGGGSAE